MARGSDDWLAGWKDHDAFIEPHRQRFEAAVFILAYGLGFATAALIALR